MIRFMIDWNELLTVYKHTMFLQSVPLLVQVARRWSFSIQWYKSTYDQGLSCEAWRRRGWWRWCQLYRRRLRRPVVVVAAERWRFAAQGVVKLLSISAFCPYPHHVYGLLKHRGFCAIGGSKTTALAWHAFPHIYRPNGDPHRVCPLVSAVAICCRPIHGVICMRAYWWTKVEGSFYENLLH